MMNLISNVDTCWRSLNCDKMKSDKSKKSLYQDMSLTALISNLASFSVFTAR